MRWPLRNQIMAPVAALLLLSIAGVSFLQAYQAAQTAGEQIQGRLLDVIATLTDASFPLTESVLRQMRGLSGADFVLADQAGRVRASTLSTPGPEEWTHAAGEGPPRTSRRTVGERVYVHAAAPARGEAVLHVLYPEAAFRSAQRRALLPPLLIGGVALVIAAGLTATVASRVTRPLGVLKDQAERISQGQFSKMEVPARQDEIRDLVLSINRMTSRLQESEQHVRLTERMRTLGQLGGGLAHQLRNAATGARMALDLHRRRCPMPDDESLDVVRRQLILMERYLQQFLRLGQPQAAPRRRLDWGDLVSELMQLVRPAASHGRVEILWRAPAEPTWVVAERDGLEHLVLNLLLNAVEASAQLHAPGAGGDETEAPPAAGCVKVELTRPRPDLARLDVWDNGAGPAADMAQRLFEAFATDKPDGAGLGLSVAQQVAQSHGGQLRWTREENWTRFTAELPVAEDPAAAPDAAGAPVPDRSRE